MMRSLRDLLATDRRSPGSRGETESADAGQRTIADFGDQWLRYPGNEGYYGSAELLSDILGPLLPVTAIERQRVAEIGSGTGRIVRMLLAAGAARVLAVEPSDAVEVLRRHLQDSTDRVEILHATGDRLPAGLELDLVFAIGVLHHIPDPDPVVAAAYRALRPGGRMLVWLYGVEGNRMTVAIIRSMRVLTTRLPHGMLASIATIGNLALDAYIPLCRRLRFLPLADYMANVLGRFGRPERYLVLYDQLRPAYAKYYTEAEARDLLERAGFVDVVLHHRRGYSWTACGRRAEVANESTGAAMDDASARG